MLQFGSCGDHVERALGDNFSDVFSSDGQSRNNDRSEINIYSDYVFSQDDSLQGDEGALILPIHEENLDIMSLSYTDLHNEVLTDSDDPWLGLINLQSDMHHQEYDFGPFILVSDCTSALSSDFFNDLPSLLDSDCATWFLSSPTDISSNKPITLVLDLDGK